MKKHLRYAIVILSLILTGCGDTQEQGTSDSAQNALQESNMSHSKLMTTKYVYTTVHIRAGAGTHSKIIGYLYKGDEVQLDSLQDNWAIVYKDGERKGYVYVDANVLGDDPLASTDTRISDDSDSDETSYSISGTDDGYKWKKTAYAAKMNLCEDLAITIGRRDARFYYDCLETFYNTSDPTLLRMTIAEIAGMASVM